MLHKTFFSLVEDVVEGVFFVCETVLEAILALIASLSSLIFNYATQSIGFNFEFPTKLNAYFPYLMHNL